jgi:hypothetical protein
MLCFGKGGGCWFHRKKQSKAKSKSEPITIQITRTNKLVLGRRYAAPVFSTL